LFVVVGPFEKRDQFAVTVKWNETPGEFDLRPQGFHGDIRLQRIWGCKNGEDFWDLEPEITAVGLRIMQYFNEHGKFEPYPDPVPIDEALLRVPPAVDDALSQLAEFGMPHLKKVVEANNVPWPRVPGTQY
jgi:hypothetical protein